MPGVGAARKSASSGVYVNAPAWRETKDEDEETDHADMEDQDRQHDGANGVLDGMEVHEDNEKVEESAPAERNSATASNSTRPSTSLAGPRSSASTSLSARYEITIDSTDTGGSSSSDSVEVISDFSSEEEQPAVFTNGVWAGPRPFRSPVRSRRADDGFYSALASSPPKAGAGGLTFSAPSPDSPLPHPPFAFDILNHAPSRHPGPPPAWKHPRNMTSDERHQHQRREDERKKRERDQRQMREEWEWEWIPCATTTSGGSAEGKATDFHSASFFAYAHLPGLAYMEGVCAVVGGTEVRIMQISAISPNQTSVREVTAPFRRLNIDLSDPDREEHFTCAWSVNISTHPYTPMLAVAGRGRVIEVFLVSRQPGGTWVLHHDRTITGHGGSIHHLAFHPSYPHLLASCSEDKTIRLWDATVHWGSNVAVEKLNAGGQRRERPRVEGELLAVLAEGGHEKAVLSCNFHAVQPLLVSSGADGFIKVWRLPPDVLAATPYWPSTPLYRAPTTPSPHSHPPVLGPPIFSSYAVHPGQWPDQVTFLSASSCTIISKAAVSHPSSRFSPRTSIKTWVPTVLDVLPDAMAEKRRIEVERSRSEALAQDPHSVPRQTSERASLPVDARSESGFRVACEAVLEGQNCIGDIVGIYRRPTTPATVVGPDDVFYVAATSTRLPLVDGSDGRQGDPALYFFRPFGVPSTPEVVTSSSESQQASTNGCVGRGRPTSKEALDQLAKELFPPDRDRLAHDFTPRLLPSAVLDIFSQGQRESKEYLPPIHFRCFAVQPNGAASIVGVGDGGLVSVWKRQRKVK